MVGEGSVVFVHEQGLADGGTSLAEAHIGDGAGQFEAFSSHADGAAGDDDDLSAGSAEGGDLLGQSGKVGGVDAAIGAQG